MYFSYSSTLKQYGIGSFAGSCNMAYFRLAKVKVITIYYWFFLTTLVSYKILNVKRLNFNV